MKVGDLVSAMSTMQGTNIQIGVIIKRLPRDGRILEFFEVLTQDGKLNTHTTATLRVKNES